MDFTSKKIFSIDNKQYITIVTTMYKGKEYALSNRINEKLEDVTEEYNIFTKENNEVIQVNDYELVNELLPIFQEKIEKEIKNIVKDDNQ